MKGVKKIFCVCNGLVCIRLLHGEAGFPSFQADAAVEFTVMRRTVRATENPAGETGFLPKLHRSYKVCRSV